MISERKKLKENAAPRREVPLPVKSFPKPEPIVDNSHQWGCTDQLALPLKKAVVVETRPDPLPEYITPQQARKWGISIRFPKGI
jgi:hypothetical protein